MRKQDANKISRASCRCRLCSRHCALMPSNVSVTVKSVVWILLTVVSFSDVTGLHLLTGLSGSPPIWLQPQMSFSSLYLFIFTHCHIKKLSKNTLTGHACIPEFTHLFLAPWPLLSALLPVLTPLFFKISFYCAFNVLSILDFSHLPILCQAQTFAASAPLCLEYFFWLFWSELSLTFNLRHHFWNTLCFYKFQSSLVCVSLGLNVLYKSCSPLCFQLFGKSSSHSFLKKACVFLHHYV